jgi:hypothetical protein
MELTGGGREQGLSQGFRRVVIRRTERIDFLCNVTLAAAVAAVITVAAVWHATDRDQAALAVASAAPLVPPRAALVQVRNPFDATEVFAFPAGTTKTKAREAVAKMLLRRARERFGQQGFGIKHADSRRLAAAMPR